MSERWYVIRTEPRSEFLAANELERQGWPVFLPVVKTFPQKPGRMVCPLFPGYMFVRCNLERGDRYYLSRTVYVAGLVHFDDTVPDVSDEVIAALQSRLEAISQEGGLWTRFEPGQKVRITSQILESLAEVAEDSDSPDGQVRVLLQFMGRLVSAKVPRRHLQPVDSQAEDQRPIQPARPPRRTRGRGRRIAGFGAPEGAAV